MVELATMAEGGFLIFDMITVTETSAGKAELKVINITKDDIVTVPAALLQLVAQVNPVKVISIFPPLGTVTLGINTIVATTV